MKVRDALVVVGGGSQGIGFGVARAAAQAGARRVVLLARRGEALARAAAAIGPAAAVRSVDLTRAAEVEAAAAAIVAEHGVPDVVVASSAQGAFRGLAESDPDDAVTAMASTYFAAFFLFRRFLDDMLARGRGHFVVVGSPVRTGPFPAVAYKASRHALHGFAEALRAELRGTPIGVTYAEPSRITEGSYFHSNEGVEPRLPLLFRDPRYAFLWQSEEQAGRMIVEAVERGAAHASPAWLRAFGYLTQLSGGALASLLRLGDTPPEKGGFRRPGPR